MEEQLQGLWSYTAHEQGGVEWSQEQVARMAKVVFMAGKYLPGWDGLWAVVTYGHEGGTWSEADVMASCRHIILGTTREREAPAPDFYLWTGGRFRIEAQRSPNEIDFEQYWQGTVLLSLQRGLYSIEGDRLTLCLADSGAPRPIAFSSREHPYQALGHLVRGSGDGAGATPDRAR